jgi:hypothetical protein
MKITDVKTYLTAAYRPGGWAARNLAPPSDALVERTYVQPRPRRSRLYRPRD